MQKWQTAKVLSEGKKIDCKIQTEGDKVTILQGNQFSTVDKASITIYKSKEMTLKESLATTAFYKSLLKGASRGKGKKNPEGQIPTNPHISI